ncbi:DUF5372 family protein, partial [Cupriavidus sp. CV2]|uniref:DUF5372 family protein n=1 Tax=Cupriavidus ulmosensis TaxID=3065913 RepID=UPI00296AA8D8
LRVDDRTVCSVPPEWTDIAAPDPEVVMGQGRALFRVADLMALVQHPLNSFNNYRAANTAPEA